MPSRTLVLADLHLTRKTPAEVTRDLSALVLAHPASRIVFDGDLFDLSADAPGIAGDRAVTEIMAAHPAVSAALGRHVETGGELWLVSGNHDAAIGSPEVLRAMLSAMRIRGGARARVRHTPWFFRDAGLHLEHGHFYDPDNAPAHPLVRGEPSLGVHFVEQFIAPAGAYAYLNANDDTPLKLFVASFRWYGPRAPYVIYRYFYTALSAMLRSGPLYRARGERRLGSVGVRAFAEEAGLGEPVVAALLTAGAEPTLESFARTFTRIYFDRVLATLSMMGGLGALAAGRRRGAGVAFAMGAFGMILSWARGHDRYGGSVTERLAKGAEDVRRATDAKLVVFGHTHAEALEDGYANTGSFAFPKRAPGRPFLEIEGTPDTPRAVRRHWAG